MKINSDQHDIHILVKSDRKRLNGDNVYLLSCLPNNLHRRHLGEGSCSIVALTSSFLDMKQI